MDRGQGPGAVRVRAEGLGKRFQLSTRGSRESFLATTRRLVFGSSERKPLWALRELSFELGPGETLGVIGPNGAGKSTLLLILAGILGPTEGRATVRGRASHLFELGTGLQPRLTLLENLSLCASLLGMRQRRFRELLPSILAFSGLEEYLYARCGELSAGLAARVPFAAAVHADPEILLVDELVAVGDAAYQEKCLKLFLDMRSQGRTMVVASHNLGFVSSLCGRMLYLRGGRAAFLGDPAEACRRYLEDFSSKAP